MLHIVQLDALQSRLTEHSAGFRDAKPFPHLVLDNLLAEAFRERLAAAFPAEDWDGWQGNVAEQDRFQPKKLTCDQIDRIPDPLDRLLMELNSGPFLEWLEQLTGIEGILADPQLFGGGLHYSGSGGMLKPHIDFHFGKNGRLHRRLNLLVYLNENWSPECNGALELWDQKEDRIVKEVFPELGRAVLFQTNADSMHGFSKPLIGRSRHSVALYYYTVEAPSRYSGDYATHWRKETNGSDPSMLAKMRRNSLRFCARMLGGVAWRLNNVSNKVESYGGRDSK